MVRLVNVTVPHMLLYLSHSNVSLTQVSMENAVLEGQGSLATLSSQSSLRLTSSLLTGISAYDHGLISLHKSSLWISKSVITNLNASLIIAQQSWISVRHSQISGILLSGNLLMRPDGGLLSCLDCSSILLSSVTCRNISANKGGVVHAEAKEPNTSAITVQNSLFENCLAMVEGGALYTHNVSLIISQSIFSANSANYGGAIHFQGSSQLLQVSNSSFSGNSALIAGSCIWWSGRSPIIVSNSYSNNSAVYGNPQASVPHHFLLLSPATLQPVTKLPLQGVTGQLLEPIVVGLYDELGQLVVSDNATIVTASLPPEFKVLGNKRVFVVMGIASFSLVFSPFSTATYNFSFSAPSIASLSFEYRFRDCQPGEVRSAGGCFPCAKNSYSLNPSDSQCQMCPLHLQCLGRAELALDAEYWRVHNLTDTIYSCPVLGSCLGGTASTCAPGYQGTLCNSCAAGYYRYASWQCRSCEHELPTAARGVLAALVVVGATAVLPQLFLAERGALYRLALVLRAFLNYAQNILFLSLLHAKWGFSILVYEEVMRVTGSLGGLIVYSGCAHGDLSAVYLQAVVLSSFSLVLFLTCVVFWSLAGWCGAVRAVSVKASCAVLYTYLPVLCLVVVSLCQCQEVAGETWLVADMTEKCWQGDHLRFVLALAVPLFVFIVLGYFFALLCLFCPLKGQVCCCFHVYLTAEYKEQVEYWEVYKMLRKLELAVLSLAYPELSIFSSSILFICILGFSLQSDIKWAPYRFPSLARINIASHLCTAFIVFAVIHLNSHIITAIASLGTVVLFILGAVEVCKGNPYIVAISLRKVDDSLGPHDSMWSGSQHALTPPPSLNLI